MKYIADRLNADVRFIDFSDYYKKKPGFIDINTQRNSQEIKHIFNANGEIIKPLNDDTTKRLSRRLRSLVAKLPFAKQIYYKLKQYYTSGERGWVLGVELKNKIAGSSC
jgi:hypothetical protein